MPAIPPPMTSALFVTLLSPGFSGASRLTFATAARISGYEIRCQTPIAYDLTYCSELGIGVHKLFAEGKTGCMVYVDSEGNVSPLYLKDLQDPATGKIPPRLVDINSDRFTSVVENILNAITPADYEAAKKYVANPEEYDFHKILNWK